MGSQRLVEVRGESNRMAIEILQIENLTKSFDGIKALDNVSLTAIQDLITLIIGPNGSGKTTLINTISGFYKPDEGKITFQANDITNLSPHEICKLGIVRTFQIPQPLKRLTVLENLLIADENPGEDITKSLGSSWVEKEEELVEKAFHYLKFLKMEHLWKTESQELSGGQLKLLEIGRALMRNAKLIVMDEPIGGINPALAHSILEKLVALKKIAQ